MVLNGLSGYRVRWRDGTRLRQRICASYDAARRLDAKMVLKQRGGQQGPRRKPQPSRNITVKDFAAQLAGA
jgi:hypothetical protein